MQFKGEAVHTPVSLLAHSLYTAELLHEVLLCRLVKLWNVNNANDRVKRLHQKYNLNLVV